MYSTIDGCVGMDKSDSVYIHPDTMQLCGITIATPTLIMTANQVFKHVYRYYIIDWRKQDWNFTENVSF